MPIESGPRCRMTCTIPSRTSGRTPSVFRLRTPAIPHIEGLRVGVRLAVFGKPRRTELSDRRFLRNGKSYGSCDTFQGIGVPEGERNIISPTVDPSVLLRITNSDVKPAPLTM